MPNEASLSRSCVLSLRSTILSSFVHVQHRRSLVCLNIPSVYAVRCDERSPEEKTHEAHEPMALIAALTKRCTWVSTVPIRRRAVRIGKKVGDAMAIRIFWTQRNGRESWLVVNNDGTVTYHIKNFGWRMRRDGLGDRNRIMGARKAKLGWPSYAKAIDKAVAETGGLRVTPDAWPGRSVLRSLGGNFDLLRRASSGNVVWHELPDDLVLRAESFSRDD